MTALDNLSRSQFLDLWHHTSASSAREIWDTGRFISHEGDRVFASTVPYGMASGYGSSAVHIRVPAARARLEDEFPSGEQHYSVHVNDLGKKNLRPLYKNSQEEQYWDDWRHKAGYR